MAASEIRFKPRLAWQLIAMGGEQTARGTFFSGRTNEFVLA